MPTATHIYVVKGHGLRIPATFTVRHECASWLRRAIYDPIDLDAWCVERYRDGDPGDHLGLNATWTVREFLAAGTAAD